MVIGLTIESSWFVMTNTTAQLESELYIMSMITDRIGRHEVLPPINHKNYNFREKKNSQVMKEMVNLHEE